ncbi:hypothetical protein HMPREF1987_02098 [Peptostreptococcaceae bacterium oral taxon 113 str. W5053]|nr:hypothetical protein HMPREF1987_02098 [Peptostreptococcaceae bacterium oral taxon 113 str. W5053]
MFIVKYFILITLYFMFICFYFTIFIKLFQVFLQFFWFQSIKKDTSLSKCLLSLSI